MNNIEEFGEMLLKALMGGRLVYPPNSLTAENIGSGLSNFKASDLTISDEEILQIKEAVKTARNINDMASKLIPLTVSLAKILIKGGAL
ncbi:MAG TPA: hypothetical protein PK650_12070 [Candidatus Sumerlaeota bacterium]|nr:hypothetical protein [Candidatus Sumerlaeota bacterium]